MLRNKANSSTAKEALLEEAAMESAPHHDDLSDHYDDEDCMDCENQSSDQDQSQRTSVVDTNTPSDAHNDGARELRETVIKKEESAVKRSRTYVGLAIAICAIAVSVAVYILAKKSDQHSFELEVSQRLAKL